MGKLRYEMNGERSGRMDNEAMLLLKNMYLAPYMQLATALIGKARYAGGAVTECGNTVEIIER
ncbi:MAG: hypothetical protein IJ191_06975 [Treponema sp.]|nr:hypothetical protein [Treponema sp.]